MPKFAATSNVIDNENRIVFFLPHVWLGFDEG